MKGTGADLPVLVRARRIRAASGPVEALLVRGGRVEAVGDAAQLAALEPEHAELDLAGLTVTAGLTDAHVHLVEWALGLSHVDLGDAGSPEAAARRVAEAVADAGRKGPGTDWIRGRGWDPHRWADAPHRSHLDAVVEDRPVLLQSHDLHSLWASSAALRKAGIDASTPDPDGGRIERDPDGRPTGVVRDNAMPLLYRAAPHPTDAERRAAVREGQERLHRLGVTGVHTVEPDTLGLLESIRAADGLRLRVLHALPVTRLDDAIRVGLRSGFGGDWLRIGGIKIFLDGALGSLTAWLREPYEGTADTGLSTLDPATFRTLVARGCRAGLAMTVHAIGDAATELALSALTAAEAALDGPVPHRIEHVQLVAPAAFGLEGRDGQAAGAGRVVCSVQPSHLMTDWRAADRHWGERARWAYAFASLEAAGYTLALGSDAPVEPPDPRQGLHAAVTRRDLSGEPASGWHPHERLSTRSAWAGYTTGPARAAGDPRQGRLAPGSFADLVAWDRDPLACE
ncbi:MAG: amidohydrolase, partial [Gemmatimonadota bacterium]